MIFTGLTNSVALSSLWDIWCEFTKFICRAILWMCHGRMNPLGHMAWQAEVSLCKGRGVLLQVAMEAAGTWLRGLRTASHQPLVPNLRHTKCTLYEVVLHVSPSSFKTDWVGKYYWGSKLSIKQMRVSICLLIALIWHNSIKPRGDGWIFFFFFFFSLSVMSMNN